MNPLTSLVCFTCTCEEEMLMWKSFPTHTTGENTFNVSDLYMAEKELSWKQFVDTCTDSGTINCWEDIWLYCAG